MVQHLANVCSLLHGKLHNDQMNVLARQTQRSIYYAIGVLQGSGEPNQATSV
jgi:hypothetical protein